MEAYHAQQQTLFKYCDRLCSTHGFVLPLLTGLALPVMAESQPRLQPPVESKHKVVLSWKFPKNVGAFTLVGRSRAADATGFAIPELGWALDGGCIVHDKKPRHVFITHTHTDHAHMLTHLKGREKCPDIYVPEHAVPLVEAYLSMAQQMTDNQPYDPAHPWTPAYTLKGVKQVNQAHGSAVEQRSIKLQKPYSVEVVDCDHSVPCVGYIFREERTKLREEFKQLPGREIAALR